MEIINDCLLFIEIGRPGRIHESRQNPDAEKLILEYKLYYSNLGENVQNDFSQLATKCCIRIADGIYCKHIDEISEMVQKVYTLYSTKLNDAPIYNNVPQETKEQLMDFFEKYITTNEYG